MSSNPIDETPSPTSREPGRPAAEDSHGHDRLLAEASRVLAHSLDDRDIPRIVARLAIPDLADWTIVDLVAETGALRRYAVAHRDPDVADAAAALESMAPDPEAVAGPPRAIRSGQPLLYDELTPETLAGEGGRRGMDAEVPLLRRLGVRSAMSIPLAARGRTIGALTFVSSLAARRYGAGERDLGLELARRSALALDNARLYQECLDAVRLRDEFLSVAAHELRTPLTSLQLALEGLQEAALMGSLDLPAGTFGARALETAERQTRRLARLVDGLLDVSRIQSGRLDLVLEDLDLAALARDVAGQLGGQLLVSGCELTLDADEPVVGTWDRSRLEQVITNLMGNALKYGAGKPVRVAVERTATTAILRVEDRGIGIPPERQRAIFERFERAASAQHFGGLGLGLYIARRIVQALHGTIDVRSEPDAGSTFTVELPLQPPRRGGHP